MELRPSSIVALLRKRNNVVLVHCYVTGHRRHVATETITRNNILRVSANARHPPPFRKEDKIANLNRYILTEQRGPSFL